MKNVKKIYKSVLIILVIISCTDDRDLGFLEEVVLPSNISALFDITQDNSGLVTITPSGEGASTFEIGLGDSSESVRITSGESIENIYTEGSYDISITAFNIVGDSTQVNQELVVSFQAPQNLEVVIENDNYISQKVNITTNANFASTYEFYSGESGVEQPVATTNIGEPLFYQYLDAGTYNAKIIAIGDAIATTEYLFELEAKAINFVQNFENPPVKFTSFGSVLTQVITNPDQSEENPTTKVAKLTKPTGAKVWSGSFFIVDLPIDLANNSKIKIKSWSPKLGAVVKVILQNNSGSISHEVDVNTTITDSWEELSYDFSGAPIADYVKVTVCFDYGNIGDGTVYYFDELKLTN